MNGTEESTTKPTHPTGSVFMLMLRELAFLIVVQTVALFAFFNMAVVEIFKNSDYTINILTSLYLVLGYKALTISYSNIVMRNNLVMLYREVSQYIAEKQFRQKIVDEMILSSLKNVPEK